MNRLVFLAVLAAAMTAGLCSADEKSKADRWEPAIAELEQKFHDSGARTGATLFVGSSSIRLWKLSDSFPERTTLNHGFGGSETADAVRYFDRLVAPARPAAIVLYAGDNDIAHGKSAAEVHEDFLSFVKHVREKLPDGTPVHYIAIKPSISRWKLRETILAANAVIRETCNADPALHFVDVWEPMLGANGEPRMELFVEDGLHLSPAGYNLWTDLVRKSLNAVPANTQ